MNSIKQKCRPKHQVLVLKCYPRVSKGAVDVRPNSSELSYLLFYATSRRSKIQKIGAFLEKKTASDVWRLRIGNVQVTLGILTALLEKSPKDAVLIAPYVLKILDLILRSNDISLIESSLPTFEAFCEHHDASSLFGDQAYARQYEAIVRSYAALASTKPISNSPPLSKSLQARWRSAGLKAIKSVASSDALASVTGRQIDVIVPLILENLWVDDDNGHFVEALVERLETEERMDSEKMSRRRASIGTAGTAETGTDPHNATFSASPNDDDRLVEEDIGLLAMQGLRSIYVVPNRLQIHGATVALFKFLFDKMAQGKAVVDFGETGAQDSGWAITMFELISKWAPVQDRYIILVVAMENLVRHPIRDDKTEQQMTLVAMIGSLLRSEVNLVGLSVMDILLGLVRQMKKLFHYGGELRQGTADDGVDAGAGDAAVLSSRKRLLDRLEQCVGDLATHVYYADQVSDMIEAILARLRPSRSSSTSSTPQGEKADGNDSAPATSAPDLAESQAGPDAYFSHAAGRVCALRVIKAILLVASPKTKITGNMNLSRNRVPMRVWEGSHWLLRDPDGEVRKAYVAALATWLDRETTYADSVANDDSMRGFSTRQGTRDFSHGDSSSRRAVSNPAARDRPSRLGPRSQFLPLLHLSVYDNALQFVDTEADIALLHALLTRLVFRLGVNSVRFGVPMIYRLQEDVQEIELPVHKVRVAAMCHGYFWALTEKFDFESSPVGRAILNEVTRRRTKGFWVEDINVPPPLLKTIKTPGQAEARPAWDIATLEKEELLPFDDRTSLVETISTNYEESSRSPPASPGASPLRNSTHPILATAITAPPDGEHERDLPSSYREQMLTEWSRDDVAAALASDGRSESLNGSRSGTTGTNLNRLTINTTGINGNGHGLSVPYGSPRNLRPTSARFPGERDRFGSMRDLRKTSVRSGVTPSESGTTRGGIASVDQLKMILNGSASAQSIMLPPMDDDSGDSMVSYYSPSEASFNPIKQRSEPSSQQAPASRAGDETPKRSASLSRRAPLSSNPPHQSTPQIEDDADEEYPRGNGISSHEDVPPVPALPMSPSSGSFARNDTPSRDSSMQDFASKVPQRKLSSRGGNSLRSRRERIPEDDAKTMDLQDLLRGIDSYGGEGSLGNITKPPY